MIRIKKEEINKQDIPAETGIFILSNKKTDLYINFTSDLNQSINHLFKIAKDDKIVFQLISQCTNITYEEHENLFEALSHKKILENYTHTKFNTLIKPYEKYVYLGIDLQNPPYLKVVEDTQQERFYIGPFKNRFFLFDLKDAMADLFKFPICPDEKPYSCIRYKEDKCSGWCIKDKVETYQKAILPFIFSDQTLLKPLKEKHTKLFDDLQFEKADKLNAKLKLIEDYYEMIKFFTITKNLNLKLCDKKRDIIISNGILTETIDEDKKEKFPIIKVEFRDNEYLAFNKDQLAERWIIYKYLTCKKDKIILDRLDEIYKKSQLKLKSLLS